jgi:hypothetical protein
MEQQQYRSYAEGGRFDPIEQTSYIPMYQQRAREREAALNRYIQGQKQNAQTAVDNATQQGETLKQLSGFSQTLTKRLGDIEEQTKKDIETGQFYDAIMADLNTIKTEGVSPQDTPEQQALQAEANSVAKTSRMIEDSTGDIAAGYTYQIDFGGVARGFNGEVAALTAAQTRYSGWQSSYLKSKAKFFLDPSMTVEEAANSGDPRLTEAAIRQSRLAFIKEHNLQYATKDNFVKYMGQTILASDASAAGNLVREGIKANREAEIQRIDGLAYDLAKTGGSDVGSIQSLINDLSNQYYTNNTGMNRGEATTAAVKGVIAQYEDSGNVDALNNLLDVQKIPGQAGTELRRQYGNIINDAIDRATDKQARLETQAAKDIEADMYRELADAKTPEDRAASVDRAIARLEASGNYRAARVLQSQKDDLLIEGSAEYNAQQLEDSLNRGDASLEDLERAKDLGQITRSQYDALKKAFGDNSQAGADKQLSSNQILKETLDSYVDRFDTDFMNAAGLKTDLYGKPLLTEQSLLTPGEAEILRGSAKNAMRRVAALTLSQLSGTESDAVKNAAISKALQEWYKAEFKTPGGTYYVAPKEKGEWNQDNRTRLKNLSNSPVTLAKPQLRGITSLRSNDFSRDVKFGATLPQSVKQNFRSGRDDQLFNAETVAILADHYQQTGTFQLGLIKAAQDLGVSPLFLLNQQIRAHPDLNLETFEAVPMSKGKSTAPSAAVAGYHTLLQMGVPSKGAAYLSGNIMQESSWSGKRTWDGGRNGGLVSWRDTRLASAQRELGDIRYANDAEQLKYMLKEMRTNPMYKSAYNTFMNPRATDRQLQEASKVFWGWGDGETGSRFRYAQQILDSVSRTRRTSSTTTRGSLSGLPGTYTTSSGFTGSTNVVSSGLKDQNNRSIKFHPTAATAWARMIRAGMPFNPKDVTSAYRTEADYKRIKAQGYNPASGSHHNFGLAIDAHGATGAWIRKYGSAYGWYPNDYDGTHGGHYEFRLK